MKHTLPIYLVLIVLLFSAFVAYQVFGNKVANTVELVKRDYIKNIADFKKSVEAFLEKIEKDAPEKEIQEAFKSARLTYKKTEFLTELYNPYTAKFINGAPIDEVEIEEGNKIEKAQGFQVIEEFLFPTYQKESKQEVITLTKTLHACAIRLETVVQSNPMTDSHIWDAMRTEIWRVETLALAGFDTPGAMNTIPEVETVLQTLETTFKIYEKDLKDKKLVEKLHQNFQKAIQYCQKNPEFLKFNVLDFLTDYLNPLSTTLHETQTALAIPFFKENRALKVDAKTLFEKNAFNANYFAPFTENHTNPERIELGKMLFYEPLLSGNGKRSCGTCHQAEKGFTDGLKTSLAIDGKNKINRNAPTILNAAFQKSLFYDSRVAYLEDQATDVISNAEEMHGSLKESVKKLTEMEKYRTWFTKAFPQEKEKALNERNLKIALASYTRSLVSLDAKFDKYMRGDKSQMNDSEKRGFNLFMTKGKCATCHFMPLFNGTIPPNYQNTESEIIGVPAEYATKNAKIDADLGKYNIFKADKFKFAFKTPTVRNAEFTAPYMHNGVYQTLEQVIEFYNLGGGKGIGIELENQTLPEDNLNLSEQEQKDLIAFMKSLSNLKGLDDIKKVQ